MFKLLRPHKYYPECMSDHVVIFRNKKFMIDVQEFYDPHIIQFNKWIREKGEDLYCLKRWLKIPLSFRAFYILYLYKPKRR